MENPIINSPAFQDYSVTAARVKLEPKILIRLNTFAEMHQKDLSPEFSNLCLLHSVHAT